MSHILTVTCADTIGIVAATSGFLADHDAFITESQQYADLESGRFFMRIEFQGAGPRFPDTAALNTGFAAIATRFGMTWALLDKAVKPRVMIAVSKAGHCLNDLLHRWRTGTLPVDIPLVVSNHEDLRGLSEWHGIPFVHLPLVPGGKAAQEAELLALVERHRIDLVVLARYMQVLSPEACATLAWRCINIHHSFLPSFKGARPYHQAHARGVKLIGATAHYVTPDLDEGPIIEQLAERVDHGYSADAMVTAGRDVEALVLARAVTWAAERRILPNGHRTVVFRR
ncbi:MAG: formyltetrahydrofolate deformylase [Alphaproteobacteria bacterium PA4]|nr:MAG: formyltetrahydrofolate deformylase [Alphaproteobacteria bacterium PA4]